MPIVTYKRDLDSAARRTACVLVALFALVASLHATTVTAKVVDPNSNPYTGTVAASLQTSVGVAQSSGPFALAADGSFSITLTDTSTVTPAGSAWVFTVCSQSVQLEPNVPSVRVCFTSPPLAIAGASVDISTSLNTIAGPLGPRIASALPVVRVTQVDVREYGASLSRQSTTVSCTSGSTTFTLAAAVDFQSGQSVEIFGCGPGGGPMWGKIVNWGGVSLTLDTAALSTQSGITIYHDDSQAIQDAHDACVNAGTSGIVALPQTPIDGTGVGMYASRPIVLHGAQFKVPCALQGQGRAATVIVSPQGLPYGRGLASIGGSNTIAAYMAGITLHAPLVGATGNSFAETQFNTIFMDLRESATMDLNGLAQYTFEAKIKPTSLVAVPVAFAVSSGTRFSGGSAYKSAATHYIADNTFGAHANGPGCKLTLSVSGTVRVEGAQNSIAAGTAYDYACTYDGATVRLYLNGTLVASQAATGTIVQDAVEQFFLGADTGSALAGGPNPFSYNGMTGDIDNIRVSKVARYTGASYTVPAEKWGVSGSVVAATAPDANVLLQLPFNETYKLFSVGRTGLNANWPVYIKFSQGSYCPGGSQADSSVLSGISFGNSSGNTFMDGMDLTSGETIRLHNLGFSITHNGLLLGNCSYGQILDDVDFNGFGGAARYGVVTTNGIGKWTVTVGAGALAYPIVLQPGTGDYDFPIIGVGQGTIVPIMVLGGGTPEGAPSIHAYFDFEQSDTVMEHLIVADRVPNLRIHDSIIGSYTGSTFTNGVVAIQGGSSCTIENARMHGAAGQDEWFHISPVPTNGCIIKGGTTDQVGVPWSLTSSAFSMEQTQGSTANAAWVIDKTGALTLGGILFANLGTPANGTIKFCSDCVVANPCAGGGTGAFATRRNGVWVCN